MVGRIKLRSQGDCPGSGLGARNDGWRLQYLDIREAGPDGRDLTLKTGYRDCARDAVGDSQLLQQRLKTRLESSRDAEVGGWDS